MSPLAESVCPTVIAPFFKSSTVDTTCLYFPLSRLHALAAKRLAEFLYAKVLKVVAGSWTGS
jgi:hypothetical protein